MLEEVYPPNEEDFRYSEYSDEPDCDFEGSDISGDSCDEEVEPLESRLSSALQRWNPDFQIRLCVPMELHHREPVFSGRLGKNPTVKRTFSLESIVTQLSLLTCSMKEGESKEEKKDPRPRRRKKKGTLEPLTAPNSATTGSKWVEFANKRQGVLDRMMRSQNAQVSANFNMDHSMVYQVRGYNSAYDLMDDHEKSKLYNCALTRGLNMPRMKKSGSTTNILDNTFGVQRRTTSAGGKRVQQANEIDFRQWKEDIVQRRLTRADSHGSLGNNSNLHGNKNDKQSNCRRPPVMKRKDQRVKLWQGDILESDLKREFTTKVKRRVKSTSAALARVTGVGESNRKHTPVGAHEEFPKYLNEDYSWRPRMPQRIRISPDLSHVITEDIKIRMGRPRYHEIRAADLQIWDKDQKLDRTHRNLKVFNWLYSLRDQEFENDIDPEIDDTPPDVNFVFPAEAMHIEACDDPDEKPLFERAASKFKERIQCAPVAC